MNEKFEDDKLPDPDSKSQRKRNMLALQELGLKLTTLSPAALKKCELPESLLSEIIEFQRLPNKHGARKRQSQYIGKLMRDLPDETIAKITLATSPKTAEEQRRQALQNLRKE